MLSDYQRYRIYEILPGAVVWGTLVVSFLGSLWWPLTMMYVIIIFDIYWVLRVVYYSFYLLVSWRRFHAAAKVNWFKKLTETFPAPAWERVKSVVFLPIATEGIEVVRSTLQALLHSTFPPTKIYIVLAGEERKMAHWEVVQTMVKREFTGLFADIVYTTHPANIPGEIIGKGSNIHYAEYEFKKYADARGWRYEDIVVSVFDIDTIIHPDYFSHLQFLYLSHPNPTRSSFQPVTLYNNNIWESHAVLRIMAFGTTFWTLFSLARLDDLVTFSSHSMSFKAIMDVGGHAKHIVSEDSRIFFQCWLHYGGDYEVTPLYIPVSMDTVHDDTAWKSLKNLYYQQRRWAWGVEHVPYLLWEFKKHPEISWWKKTAIFFHEFEGKWSWAVVAILVTVMGRLPLWLADDQVRQSALFFTTPHVLQVLMTIAMLGMVVSAVLSLLILPPLPHTERRWRYVYMLIQWLIVPFSLVFFSAIPCIDAITHLMFGKYLGFNISQKKRANPVVKT